MSLYHALRPLFFSLDPEWIHRVTLSIVGAAGRIPPVRGLLRSLFTVDDSRLRVEAGGLAFANPVGLAAGFDKTASPRKDSGGRIRIRGGRLGLGLPVNGQSRAPETVPGAEDEAIVVNYGVPNDGAEVVARRFASTRLPVPLGINLVETNTGRPADANEVVGRTDRGDASLSRPRRLRDTESELSQYHLGTKSIRRSGHPEIAARRIRAVQDHAAHVPEGGTDNRSRVIEGTLAAMDPFPFVKGIVFGLPTGKPYDNLNTPVQVLKDSLARSAAGPPGS